MAYSCNLPKMARQQWGQMTSEFIHKEILIMDYNGLSWTIIEGGGVMIGMDDFYFYILIS